MTQRSNPGPDVTSDDMSRIVVKLQRPARRCAVLLDGVLVAKTSTDVVRISGIRDLPDDELTAESVLRLLHAAVPRAAWEHAVSLLAYRERSVAEIRARLRDATYDEPTIEATVARLLDSGLLDDERFAYAYVRTKIAAGWGSVRIRRNLRAHDISESLITEVFNDLLYGDSQLEAARRAVSSVDLNDPRARRSAYARLVRRGYPTSIVREALRGIGHSDPAP